MIYAISDIHGDLKQAKKLLKEYNVIEDNDDWIAGESTLVCVGDSTDRGPDGIDVLQFFYNLKNQASTKGGRVIHLMGNHDALILCVALEKFRGLDDYEHQYIFNGNGGKMHEAVSLSRLHNLRKYVQSFPLMCRVDDILFQHADGFNFYNKACGNEGSPEDRIAKANAYGKLQSASAWGAWNLFYDLTEERHWNRQSDILPEYLASLEADLVVHGHTGFYGSVPKQYLNNMAINIDATLSRGYYKYREPNIERGCVLVIDSPGKNIIL